MNITELARILKVPTQELRDKLPKLGFDIGQKAIKVDPKIADRIIKQWSILIKALEAKELAAKKAVATTTAAVTAKKEVKIPNFVTVRNFSLLTNVPVNKILAELMKNSIFSSLNEKIDFDTAAIIGSDLGFEVKLIDDVKDTAACDADIIEQVMGQETEASLKSRPPVIVVMGHVDHGKTKLLDAIRRTDVAAGEAGGITQHIGAYQITHKNKVITFIDTPGHEAFTAMRNRGAHIADIAILVVAADDGVKPQTVEAYRIIEAAKLPFVVAINKIDKPEASLDKVKQELSSQLNILPEDWGGKTICLPISAKNNLGITELLDMLLLTADMEAKTIKANPEASACGTIIESHIDRGEGPVATVLIQNGKLRIGNPLTFNGLLYGKVRAMKDCLGKTVVEATPAMPVKIIGLKLAPAIGDIMKVGQGEKVKTRQASSQSRDTISSGLTAQTHEEKKEADNGKSINLLIKSDVLGSGEAIEGSLAKIETPEIKIKILNKGLGNITEGDVARAGASQAKLIGFNVKITPLAARLARETKVPIKTYKIIYELINDLKAEVANLVELELERINLGRLKVLAIFRTEKTGQIVGGRVIDGRTEVKAMVEVTRDKQVLTEGKLIKLQIAKQDVTMVETNQECGLSFEGKPVIKVNDILQFYKMEKKKKV